MLEELGEAKSVYDICYFKGDRIERFHHTNNYGENYSTSSMVSTNDGGTHQSVFREGILKGVNELPRRVLPVKTCAMVSLVP